MKIGARMWAGLDVLTFVRNLLYITQTAHLGFSGLNGMGIFNVIARDLLIVSLLFSAYFTIRRQKVGLWIYFVQLPFRFYFFLFSFSMIWDLPIRDAFRFGTLVLFGLMLLVEIIRIVYSFNYYSSFLPKSKVGVGNGDLLDGSEA